MTLSAKTNSGYFVLMCEFLFYIFFSDGFNFKKNQVELIRLCMTGFTTVVRKTI